MPHWTAPPDPPARCHWPSTMLQARKMKDLAAARQQVDAVGDTVAQARAALSVAAPSARGAENPAEEVLRMAQADKAKVREARGV